LPGTEPAGYSIETGVAAVNFGKGAARQAPNRRCPGYGLGSETHERCAKTSVAVSKPVSGLEKETMFDKRPSVHRKKRAKRGRHQPYREPVTGRIFSYLPRGKP